jgi:hypothetical protein
LLVQQKFYEIMERYPSVFKISSLLASRKKFLRDSAFAKNLGGKFDESNLVF